jgi:hypothetical protein
MKLIRLLAAVLAGAATLVLPRRRPGRLRLDRARAALRLAARGGGTRELVLLHGQPGSPADWQQVAGRLPAQLHA